MKEAESLHIAAMELAEKAFLLQRHGKLGQATELYKAAFEKERQAAELMESCLDLEPTRSVLYRSAASLALDCDKPREAEKLIARALSGNPPEEIADELRDLLEQVCLQRHLQYPLQEVKSLSNSGKRDIQLKGMALLIFGAMVMLACFPLVKGGKDFGVIHATVAFLGTAGIIVTILSDRIVSLSLSKDAFRLQLSEWRKDIQKTLSEFRSEFDESLPASSDSAEAVKTKLDQAEEMLKEKPYTANGKEMLQEATTIGQAMAILRQIMHEYRKTRS